MYHCSLTGCAYNIGGKTFNRKDSWLRHMIEEHKKDFEEQHFEPIEDNIPWVVEEESSPPPLGLWSIPSKAEMSNRSSPPRPVPSITLTSPESLLSIPGPLPAEQGDDPTLNFLNHAIRSETDTQPRKAISSATVSAHGRQIGASVDDVSKPTMHHGIRYLCRDPVGYGMQVLLLPRLPLEECPLCRSGYLWNTHDHAVGHLRRVHFYHPEDPTGDAPAFGHLAQWITKVHDPPKIHALMSDIGETVYKRADPVIEKNVKIRGVSSDEDKANCEPGRTLPTPQELEFVPFGPSDQWIMYELACKDLSQHQVSFLQHEDFKNAPFHIEKLADPVPGTHFWRLKSFLFKHLDVWEHNYATQRKRNMAIRNLIGEFDRLNLPLDDPAWDRLNTPSRRGQGICLSRLNFERQVSKDKTAKEDDKVGNESGLWTEFESLYLEKLLPSFGPDWEAIASLIGTKTPLMVCCNLHSRHVVEQMINGQE